MITEVCQIIRAVQFGDKGKALSYAKLLAENLDKAGQHKEATRILRALEYPTTQGQPVVMDSNDDWK